MSTISDRIGARPGSARHTTSVTACVRSHMAELAEAGPLPSPPLPDALPAGMPLVSSSVSAQLTLRDSSAVRMHSSVTSTSRSATSSSASTR
eukprot:352598-Chlamydomonas_euryale.AAC.22